MVGIQVGTIPISSGEESVLIGGDVIIAVEWISFTNEQNFKKMRMKLDELDSGDFFTLIVLREGRKR